MPNKQLNEVNLGRDLGALGQNFALKFIDNGTSYNLYVEDLGQNPTQPALASQITATGIPIAGVGGAPGGSNAQLQYNNAGAFGGVSGVTSNGTYILGASGGIRITDLWDSSGTFSLFFELIASSNLSIGALAGNVAATLGTFNTALGQVALAAVTTGTENIAIGSSALANLTTGGINLGRNTCVGVFAGINLVTGAFNVALGRGALNAAGASSASANCAVGYNSLLRITTGGDNIALGALALDHITTGSQNVAIGTNAGTLLTTASGNVFLGYNAGAQEAGSNKLYIANSNTVTPLIGGDFATPTVTITGNLKLGTTDNGLYVKEGTNATLGTGTLNGATEVTIGTTKVTANSRIFLAIQAPGGTPLGVIYVSSRVPGTGFGVKGAATDTSDFAWWIVEPT